MRLCGNPSRAAFLLLISAVVWLGVGCETAAPKKRVASLPPAPPPTSIPAVETLLPGPLNYWPTPQVRPPDPVKILIGKVKAAYQSGVQAYQAGHLVKARLEFDHAVDLVLQSGLDLHSHPELAKEFDLLLDNIHRFELAALKEGDGFTERKPVPAAIEEVAELPVEPLPDPQLREKLMKQVQEITSDLPLVINDYVLTYIKYFSSRGRGGIVSGWRRAGRYRDMIRTIFAEEGVPQDLIYLAQAESSFQPLALSRAGARGMWQFMAFTGKQYQLEKNWWVDLRQDPEKATRAAARHLRDLYAMFGDWYLAMAAYNSGPLNVQRAVERTGHADFWELYKRNQLPRETRNYVPIILAVTIMAKNPAAYGLTEVEPDPPIQTETVKLSSPADVRLIAETIDCTVELLQDLNPSLLRWVTPKTEGFELRLPAGTKERFLERIALIPEDKRVWWRWHRVAEGESLARIAKAYKTTPAAIAEVNNLSADQELLAGGRLVIPITPKNTSLEAAALGGKAQVVSLRYRVRKGDTLALVADRFGVSADEVKQWNKMKTNSLQPGRVLLIQAVQRQGSGTRGQGSGRAASKNPASSSGKKKPQTVRSKAPAKGPDLASARRP